MSSKKVNSSKEIAVENKKKPNSLLVNSSKFKLWIFIGALLMLFIPTYLHIFDTKVAPLGDNAMYYTLAKALDANIGFVNAHVINHSPSNHFPPGYPFFLSMVMKFFGDGIPAMHIANGILYFLSLIIVFFLIRAFTKNDLLSFIFTAALLFNQHLLQYSTWMMSEIPFLFITSLSILLLVIWNKRDLKLSDPIFYLAIVSIAASYYVRSQGIALLGGFVLFLAFRKKWLQIGIGIVGVFALLFPWMYRNSKLGEEAYVTALKLKNYYNPAEGFMQTGDWFDRIWENFARYINTEILSGIFGYEATYDAGTTGSGHWFVGLLVIAFIVFAIFRIKEYKWLIAGYLGATFAILMLWPPVWYGTRFMLPTIPLLVFLFYFGIKELIVLGLSKANLIGEGFQQKVAPFFFVIIFLVYFPKLELLHQKAVEPDNPLFRNFYGLAEWTKTNVTNKDAVFISRKSVLFYLFSGHYGEGFSTDPNPDSTIVYYQRAKATHIVYYGDGQSQMSFVPAYNQYPEKFKLLQKAIEPDVYLFEFHPELGYHGNIVDGKKEGNGDFVFEDGTKYSGEWKNNTQNGKGILIDKNGKILQEGIWENGIYKGNK